MTVHRPKYSSGLSAQTGFTLIELLMVVAILGVLIVVVAVAINPIQQLAKVRDTGRKSTVVQLGKALESYGISHNDTFFEPSTSWISGLVTLGEVNDVPTEQSYMTAGTECRGEAQRQNNYCYNATGGAIGSRTAAVIYATMESDSEGSKCPDENTIFVWSTVNSRAGTICKSNRWFSGAEIAAGFSGQWVE